MCRGEKFSKTFSRRLDIAMKNSHEKKKTFGLVVKLLATQCGNQFFRSSTLVSCRQPCFFVFKTNSNSRRHFVIVVLLYTSQSFKLRLVIHPIVSCAKLSYTQLSPTQMSLTKSSYTLLT